LGTVLFFAPDSGGSASKTKLLSTMFHWPWGVIVRLTPEAERDLADIWGNIAADNPKAAARVDVFLAKQQP